MESKIKVIPNFCLWQDLLGYGNAFRKHNWEITGEVITSLFRLKSIQERISIYDPFFERVFTLNDGMARTFDVPTNNVNLILGWIQYIIRDFYMLNREDKSRGFPGMRGVLSFGERAELIERDILSQDHFIFSSEEKKEEYRKQAIIYTPKQMQMNTAFSKAFLIEESGSDMDVSGCNLYIDEKVLEQLEIIINNIKYDRFGLLNGDTYLGRDYLQYNFLAKSYKEGNSREFVVVASINGKEECTWDYFRMSVINEVVYNNERRNINTRLYTPCSIRSSLYSASKSEEIKWNVNDI